MPGTRDQRAGAPLTARAASRLQLVGSDGVRDARRAISVLYVEDDPDDVFLLGRQLRALPNFSVDLCHAATLAAARDAVAGRRFDVVLCDFWLGRETAIPLIDDVKLLPAPSPVVLVSSLENDDIELIGRRAGVAGFVAKADLSAAALDRIFATLVPAEETAAPPAPQTGAAAWLKALIRGLDAARPRAAAAPGPVLAEMGDTEALRREIAGLLAGLEQATRAGVAAVGRFDAVPHLVDAVDRARSTAGQDSVRFLPPATPIPVEASPSLFGDLLQGFLAEAADAAGPDAPVRVTPRLAAGALVLELSGGRETAPRAGAGDGPARARAAADARRLVVRTLGRAVGGRVAFAPPAGGEQGVFARLEMPLRPDR